MALATIDDVFPGSTLYEVGVDMFGNGAWLSQLDCKSEPVLHYFKYCSSPSYMAVFKEQVLYPHFYDCRQAYKFLSDMGIGNHRYNVHYTYLTIKEAFQCFNRLKVKAFYPVEEGIIARFNELNDWTEF